MANKFVGNISSGSVMKIQENIKTDTSTKYVVHRETSADITIVSDDVKAKGYGDNVDSVLGELTSKDMIDFTSTTAPTDSKVKLWLDPNDDADELSAKDRAYKITLTAANWDSTAKTQTVTINGISTTETDQLIIPTPAIDSQTAYYDSRVICTHQTTDSLTFTCKTIPTVDLDVYIICNRINLITPV